MGAVCVSVLCKTSDARGLCTSCKSVLNEVKSDGSCGLKNCVAPETLNQNTGNCDKPSEENCNPGYFLIGEDCYLLPPNCQALSPLLTCEVCNDGYTHAGGSCVKRTRFRFRDFGRGGPGSSGATSISGDNGNPSRGRGSGAGGAVIISGDSGARSSPFSRSRFLRI